MCKAFTPINNYLDSEIKDRLHLWANEDTVRRIWRKDPSVWIKNASRDESIPDLTDRLGWLELPGTMQSLIKEFKVFAESVKNEIKDIILLGMGGSSLAPEVMMDVFGGGEDSPSLTVLDSTNPETILSLMPMIEPDKTLFIVSSKSGGTIETLSLYKFFSAYYKALGLTAGDHFIAITDPGSGLEKLAIDNCFRKIFTSPKDIGGRYSALTPFGIVPAAMIGADIEKLFKHAKSSMIQCGSEVEILQNPAAYIGAFMSEAALKGRDKLTFLISPSISRLGAWIEQLIAESLGKNGKGIMPVIDEKLLKPEGYGSDRAFVYIKLDNDDNSGCDDLINELSAASVPVLKIEISDKYDLGGQFFIWEFATALAASALGVNPFDQPNVESAKVLTRSLMDEYNKTGKLNTEKPLISEREYEIYSSLELQGNRTGKVIESFLKTYKQGDYIAIMAYLPYDEEINDYLEAFREHINSKINAAVTLGYGPRFLHSTGQLHKGGGDKGLFIQITHRITEDLLIPGETYSFGTLITAQALGDYAVLKNSGRSIIRLHIKGDLCENLESLVKAV